MGKIQILTARQKKVLSFVKDNPYLTDRFYFTGGTALSHYYLQHRLSEDLDFFSEKEFNPETIFSIVTNLANKLSAKVTPRFIDNRMYICTYQFPDKTELKVDFCHYPYPLLKKGNYDGKLKIDSLLDIAVNKITTIGQRTTTKDFVDLYYLWQKFGIWDLIYGAEKKFNITYESYLLGSDLLAFEQITDLPNMLKPLTLSELQSYFRKKAVELAKKSVEP
ncbi:nucleotidyl transferase AbiEii/AbiGii toxin family protein [Patescibacteria group bacterium]|nr:nucleotidyl transferase AbiEii/AbiGii toxin family protein [Patescibacteria group bacterium]MBU1472666.1 nucleotidyl transferase AbiEii/AbiGii toxin family protein [Patescibacteria group bacterium]MBU2459904.1 nucleotidyl transferase AbiEii/AbiGii toxin family protein [Patescibacteria group bacterium]MBU2544706.1 nucleotidyl transferase AbiEii/AbiGii toxin family protein [Patescibacteria group bacterium]